LDGSMEQLNLDEAGKQKAQQFAQGMVNTRFVFNDDQSFNFYLPDNAAPFMKNLEFLNNQSWRVRNGLIEVGADETGWNIANIEVLKKGNNTLFKMGEAPFFMHVVKE